MGRRESGSLQVLVSALSLELLRRCTHCAADLPTTTIFTHGEIHNCTSVINLRRSVLMIMFTFPAHHRATATASQQAGAPRSKAF